MIKIVLDLDYAENGTALVMRRYAFPRRFAPQIVSLLGATVAFGHLVSRSRQFVGLARFDKLSWSDEDYGIYVMLLDEVTAFDKPTPTDTTRPGPDIPFCWLSEEEGRVLAGLAEEPGFQAVAEGSVALDIYERIVEEVLHNFEHRCALTDAPVSRLDVVAIQPRELGGDLHVGNLLPLSPPARAAFIAGHVAIGLDFRIRIDPLRIDPELEKRLRVGRIRIPKQRDRRPDPRFLAFHLTHVFGTGPSRM